VEKRLRTKVEYGNVLLGPTKPSQAILCEKESMRQKGDQSLDAPDSSDYVVRGAGAVCASAASTLQL